jgi:Zn-dependent peptidase ImmA (M78 family)
MLVEVTGDRVRQARILRRLTNGEVAEAMEWAQATQTRLEKSDRKTLDPGLAERLSRVLRFPLSFLTAQALSPLEESALRYRAPKSTTQHERSYLTEYARLIGELTEKLDEQHGLPLVKVPRLDPEVDPISAARIVRKSLRLETLEPVGYLTHKVERMGIPVVMRTIPSRDYTLEYWNRDGDAWVDFPERGERHFGYSTWVGEYYERPLIVLRAITSWERTRWTVAHELGHVALHHTSLPADAEEAASRFASELLAPSDAIAKELGKHVTLADLVPVKLKWGISLGALIRHLSYSGLVSDERAAALQKQLYTRINPTTGRTWGVDEPGWDDREPERPGMLSRWSERCWGNSLPHEDAHTANRWPADLLESVFSAQRTNANSRIHTSSQQSPDTERLVPRHLAEVVDIAQLRRNSSSARKKAGSA